MKAKVWIFSAVMGLATLAAFESFSAQPIFYYRTNEGNPNTCTIITVGCTQSGEFQCRVIAPQGARLVWNNTTCSDPTSYVNNTPLLPG